MKFAMTQDIDEQGCRARFALIVEDHPLVAESLAAVVRDSDAGLEVVCADSLRAALSILASRSAPVLILTDLTLSDTQGTDAVRCLREAATESPLLVVTGLDDPVLRSQSMALGATGFLIKSASVSLLREAIGSAVGRRGSKGDAPSGRVEPLHRLLTPKQIEVLEELAAGRRNKEIATRMNVSDQTVSSHMKEILGRLAVRNRTEAVVRYLQLVNSPRVAGDAKSK